MQRNFEVNYRIDSPSWGRVSGFADAILYGTPLVSAAVRDRRQCSSLLDATAVAAGPMYCTYQAEPPVPLHFGHNRRRRRPIGDQSLDPKVRSEFSQVYCSQCPLPYPLFSHSSTCTLLRRSHCKFALLLLLYRIISLFLCFREDRAEKCISRS